MRTIIAITALIMISGCSSIISGTDQTLTINTNPAGAKCVLNRNGQVIGQVESTPGGIVVERTKHDINVVCSKAGYQDATYYNKSGVEGATFGNIILGGGVGWAIDSASGADNHYTDIMNITLVPLIAQTSAPETSATHRINGR